MAPVEVVMFVEELVGRGFREHTVSTRGPLNQVVEFVEADATVQVLVDRGQWFVALAVGQMSNVYDFEAWESCLKGTDVSADVHTFADAANWILAALGNPRLGAVSEDCLLRARGERVARRLGLA